MKLLKELCESAGCGHNTVAGLLVVSHMDERGLAPRRTRPAQYGGPKGRRQGHDRGTATDLPVLPAS